MAESAANGEAQAPRVTPVTDEIFQAKAFNPRVAVSAGADSVGQRHLSQLYPEAKTPTGSNVLMVFAVGE